MKVLLTNRLIHICLFLAAVSCRERSESLFTLMDSEETGIDFENKVEENKKFNILSYEYMYNGGGVAAGDFNNDGLQDLFFTGNSVSNKLYINKGNWQFTEIAKQAGVEGRDGWKTGVTLADVNSDGFLDIYLCYSGSGTDESRTNELFINNGKKIPTFDEKAAEFGLDAPGTYSTQASFFDYDKDGDLDMFLLNHAKITYSPFHNTRKLRNKRHSRYGNRLYRNDDGFYKDVSEQAGIHGSGINFGLGVSVSDINLDGWPDIYVTNDYEEQDFFYLNKHDGTFKECLKESFRHISRFGMGCDVADYNNDGLPDVFVVDMLPEDSYRQKLLKGPDEYDKYNLLRDSGYHHQNMRNTLQLNLGNNSNSTPVFSEIGQLAGVSNTDWSWCPLFVDLNNDGRKDLFITNGYLRDFTNLDFLKYTFDDFRKQAASNGEAFDSMAAISQMPSTKIRNYCFSNNGDLTFTNMSEKWGFNEKAISNGAVWADLDNDGDQDIIINNINESAHVYRNNTNEQSDNHFVKIKLVGGAHNTTAIGAKVFVRTDTVLQVQENFPTRGFQSSVPHELLFGLGNSSRIKEIIIQWPDSKFSKIKNINADTTIILNYGENTFDSAIVNDGGNLFVTNSKASGIFFKHSENQFTDYKAQYLLPYQLSSNGPCLAKADVNLDGYDDFYVGGAAGQSGELFISDKGTFRKATVNPWSIDSASEDTDAIFFDADQDSDLDLYVVSGGAEFSHENAGPLQDRLYINDGNGNYQKTQNVLPEEKSNGSCIATMDFDHDGDHDLFIGGKSLPGYFPLPAYSLLLRNDSKGNNLKFTNITPPFLTKPGMINTAIWFDYNNDAWEDLIMAGDFTPILIYENNKGTITEGKQKEIIPESNGMWRKIIADDLDNDGDKDLVAGNLGTNFQFKVSPPEPLTIHYGDFNEDGKIDPILSYYIQGKSASYPSRDEILDQLPHLRRKFIKYADYAKADLTAILSVEEIRKARVLKVETLHSILIENDGGTFRPLLMPGVAQFSPVNCIITDDFDKDGFKDILLSGNFYPFRVQIGRSDSGSGLLLKGSSSGTFNAMQFRETGFFATGDVRSMAKLNARNNDYILVGVNDDSLKIFKINK